MMGRTPTRLNARAGWKFGLVIRGGELGKRHVKKADRRVGQPQLQGVYEMIYPTTTRFPLDIDGYEDHGEKISILIIYLILE
jgi:hypothetical protein